MVNHNVPLAFAEHLSPLFREIFPDSDIAKSYASAKTKTTCIINGALKPYYQSKLVQLMKNYPYSLLIDGSNDTGRDKMNPMTVKIFDTDRVKHRFLDMCTTSGKDAGTAETIFNKMEEVLVKHSIPWSNCVSLSVDNTSVNLGRRNSLKSRILEKNSQVYVIGCPCHILHNTSSKAAAALNETTGFDVEEVAVDISYWFDKSTKRKAGLEEFCIFCDTAYKEVISHVSTRWLSLEKAVNRILELYDSLSSYFKSNSESQARFRRLHDIFANPMSEIYLLFVQSIIPTFTRLNMLLQREDPMIFLIFSQIRAFVKNLMCKFVCPEHIINAGEDITKVAYDCPSNQLDNDKVYIGMFTRSKLRKLLDDGDLLSSDVRKFITGVRAFYENATSYALSHLPFEDALLKNAQFVDIMRRTDSYFEQVQYFVERFSDFLPYSAVTDQELLFGEFTDFQTMQDTEIPSYIWADAKVREKDEGGDVVEYHRMDILWSYIWVLLKTLLLVNFAFLD